MCEPTPAFYISTGKEAGEFRLICGPAESAASMTSASDNTPASAPALNHRCQRRRGEWSVAVVACFIVFPGVAGKAETHIVTGLGQPLTECRTQFAEGPGTPARAFHHV